MRTKVFLSAVLAIVASVTLAGCQLAPTRVNENPERNLKTADGAPEPVVITEKTVVLDARANFEYTMAHIPRSVPIQWTDFTQGEKDTRGVLQADLFDLTRRLARIGVSPDSEIVVVGNGLSGNGEEGRVAWTLAYLGIKNVSALPIGYFTGALTTVAGNPPQPVPLWQPQVDESLLATREEILFVINNRGTYAPVEFKKGAGAKLYKLLDVRTAREYLNKEGLGLEKPIPNMEAVNTPWTEFFDETGRATPTVIAKLNEVGITSDQRIILVDDQGLRSAAVTMALRELGFKDVANCAGGLQELLGAALKKPAARKRKKR